jgi:hypothetical protein
MQELWVATPGKAMRNALTVERVTDHQAKITLIVCKPGSNWEGSVTLQESEDFLVSAMKGAGATTDWIQQYVCSNGNVFTAFRVWRIRGTPYILCWTLKHVKLDDSTYQVDDRLDVLDWSTLPKT